MAARDILLFRRAAWNIASSARAEHCGPMICVPEPPPSVECVDAGYWNARLTVTCPSGTEGDSMVIEPGRFFSVVSQQAADDLAQAWALTQMVCMIQDDRVAEWQVLPEATVPESSYLLDTVAIGDLVSWVDYHTLHEFSLADPVTIDGIAIWKILETDDGDGNLLRDFLGFIDAGTFSPGDVLDVTQFISPEDANSRICVTLICTSGAVTAEVPAGIDLVSETGGVTSDGPTAIALDVSVNNYDMLAVLLTGPQTLEYYVRNVDFLTIPDPATNTATFSLHSAVSPIVES